MALLVEGGLTTPTAELVFNNVSSSSASRLLPKSQPQPCIAGNVTGATAVSSFLLGREGPGGSTAPNNMCRELEEECPTIFAQVDLSCVQARLGTPGPGGASELCRRYVQCVSAASLDDSWQQLAGGIKAMTAENPRGAVEACAEKLQQLRQAEAPAATVVERARLVIEALLTALTELEPRPHGADPDRSLSAPSLVEQLLARTGSLRFVHEDDVASPTTRGAATNSLPRPSCV